MRWPIAIGVVLFAALALKAGLIAFAAYAIFILIALIRYFAREWLASIELERVESEREPMEIGASADVLVRIRNVGRWTVPWVLVEDLLPDSALRQRPPRVKIKGKRLRILMLRPGRSAKISYSLVGLTRGYYQVGPTVLETGDLFGFHRRHRVGATREYLTFLPPIVMLDRYDHASARPIGEINLAPRLFEDPTRNAGVRPYVPGDPLTRIHWRATARTGQLHSRVYEPTSLAGATIVLDFNDAGYPPANEPFRSELAISVAVAVAHALTMLKQQVGLVSNGRDAADRLREETPPAEFADRDDAREGQQMADESDRLRPVVVETRRGYEQLNYIREQLARLELSGGMSFARLILESTARFPRDATVLAIVPSASPDAASVLGGLRRQGFAVSVILVAFKDEDVWKSQATFVSQGIRDVRVVATEADIRGYGAAPDVGADEPLPLGVVLD